MNFRTALGRALTRGRLGAPAGSAGSRYGRGMFGSAANAFAEMIDTPAAPMAPDAGWKQDPTRNPRGFAPNKTSSVLSQLAGMADPSTPPMPDPSAAPMAPEVAAAGYNWKQDPTRNVRSNTRFTKTSRMLGM